MPRKGSGPRVKKRPDRECWDVITYERGNKRRLATGFSSPEHAGQWLAEWTIRQQRPQGPGHSHERLITDVLTDYIMEHGPEVKSQNTLKQSAKELAVFWDTLTVADITEGTCRQYYNHRNRLYKQRHNTNADISNAMVNRELRTLKAAVNADYKAGRLIEPRHVHTFKETNARRDIPERREVLLMARSARGYMRKFILIAYYTGQRKHTILSLRWANVGGHMIDFQGGAPDTAKRGGQIPMPDKLKSFMKIWRKFSTPTRHVIERRGRPVKDIKKGFKNVRDATGLDFTPYSFRHASIVRQLRAGVTPYDVAKWHETSVDVIEKHYGHYKPQYLEQARRSK